MKFPPTKKLVRDVEEFIDIELADRRKNPSDTTTWIGCSDLVAFGLQAYLYRSPKYGRDAIGAAKVQLLEELGEP